MQPESSDVRRHRRHSPLLSRNRYRSGRRPTPTAAATTPRRYFDALNDEGSIGWVEAHDALSDQVARVTSLLRSVRNPEARTIGEWNVAELAAHLHQAWIMVTALARDDLSEVHQVWPHLAGRPGGSLTDDLWDFSGVTVAGVSSETERDLRVLADRIEAHAQLFLDSAGADLASRRHAWVVEGVTVDTTMLLCHLLNEMVVHGYDIARADGRSWPIPRAHAALVLEGFLVPIASALGPRTMVDQGAARDFRATYELHVRGGSRYLFTFDDGALTIESPGTRRVDCHISADPVAMVLVAWRRRSQWPAIARGELIAWGRKPWLATRFQKMMRNP